MKSLIFCLLVLVALSLGSPLEPKRSNVPLVVDVPAGFGLFNDDDDSVASPSEKEAEIIQSEAQPIPDVVITGSSEEQGPNKKGDNGDKDPEIFRIPTIFVIRRPVLSDRFPFFQSPPISPFQGFRPFSFFDNRRPFLPSRPQKPSTSLSDSIPNDSEESTLDVLSHMDQMMKRMQEQMSKVWGTLGNPSFHRRPLRPIFPTLDSSDEDNNGSNETNINLDNLPPNYSNSTSETKVIDGHVVQVNKTIHKISSGNNTSGYFHFEVINVRPTDTPKKGDDGELPTVIIPEEKPIDDLTPTKDTSTEVQPPTKVEDPSLNEVGISKSDGADNVSVPGVDSGLVAEPPRVEGS